MHLSRVLIKKVKAWFTHHTFCIVFPTVLKWVQYQWRIQDFLWVGGGIKLPK